MPAASADAGFGGVTDGRSLEYSARSSDFGDPIGEYIDGDIQAFGRSIFCIDLPFFGLDDCTLHASFVESLPVPPGTSLQPSNECFGQLDLNCLSGNFGETPAAAVRGVIEYAQDRHPSYRILISADAQALMIVYPVSAGGEEPRRPDTFRVSVISQLIQEPIVILATALMGVGLGRTRGPGALRRLKRAGALPFSAFCIVLNAIEGGARRLRQRLLR